MRIEDLDTAGPYQVIYADPPWQYSDKANAGKRGAVFKYNIPGDDWLKQLPVRDLADDDCALFLWVTMPKLMECFSLVKAWGFDYKTVVFTWVKRNKIADTWFWGMGNWTRACAELCLLAIRGKPKRVSAKVHSVVDARLRGHSQKPDEVRERIVHLMGDVPRIELFARQEFEGWDCWGNEIETKSEAGNG